jgi:hypothetical protein
MQQLAFFTNTHEKFRGLLMSTAPEKRREAYEALRPHLCFVPKPLDVYQMEMCQKAEREQLPGYNRETGELTPFQVPEISLDGLATEVIEQMAHEKHNRRLELVCAKCTVFAIFPADTRKEADKAAHSAGWRSAEKKSYCPKHVPTRLSANLLCTECTKETRIRAWDEQDAYSQARLLGWSIGDAAKCPQCSARPVLVQ